MHEPISAEEISSGQPSARGGVADLGELVGAVGGVGAVDHRAELVEVDLDHLVEVRRPGRRARRRRRGGRAATASAASAMAARPVARRYAAMLAS